MSGTGEGDGRHDGRRHGVLAIDTATTRVVIATGTPDGTADGVSTWVAGYRHGETLLPSIQRFLGEQNLRRSRLTGIVVGTGPGAFTGLRVGLATAKGLAHGLRIPLVGVPTGSALLAAVDLPDAVLLLPAGPSDRVLVRRDAAPRLLPGGTDPDLAAGETLVAVDLDGRAPADALAHGERARDALGATLLRLGAARLLELPEGELATVVPEYVTLPRGAQPSNGTVEWSRDPPVRLVIEPMGLDDVPAIQAIEEASFSQPWPPDAYRSELQTNRMAHYLIARVDDEVVAYGGMWLMVDEAHITTFAVDGAWRRQGIGERLLLAFLDLAIDRSAHEATLEVRLSNLPARRLYEKYGFRPVGLRPNYYSDDHEDALIMTTEPLAEPRMLERIARLRAALDLVPAPTRPTGDAIDGDRP